MIKVILVIFWGGTFETAANILLKIPGNSWKELRDLVGEGILRTFAEKRWKGTVFPEMSGWWRKRL